MAPLPSHLMSIDPDLLKWFKARTVDYEAQINTVLRSYMEANRQGGTSNENAND